MDRLRLEEQGCGALTEIDVRATFKEKLALEFRPYTIPGACNPTLAAQALGADLGIGPLLPCSVCALEEPSGAVVSIARPAAMFQIADRPALAELAGEADARLRRALERLLDAPPVV